MKVSLEDRITGRARDGFYCGVHDIAFDDGPSAISHIVEADGCLLRHCALRLQPVLQLGVGRSGYNVSSGRKGEEGE